MTLAELIHPPYNSFTRISTTRRSLRKSHIDRSRSFSYPRRCPCHRSAEGRIEQHVDELRGRYPRRQEKEARNDVLVRAYVPIFKSPKSLSIVVIFVRRTKLQSSKRPVRSTSFRHVSMCSSNSCQRPRDNANASTRI